MRKGLWVGGMVILAIALGVSGYYFSRSTPAGANFSCAALAHKPVIAAFGDSLVYGYGAESQHGFVGPLSQQIGTTIIDDGVNGNTTADALARISGVVAQHPDIVLVLLGGNDALQQIPQATTQSNLEQVISTFQQDHIHVVLLGVLGGYPVDPYASMFQALAKQYDVPYVSNVLNGLITDPKYMYDEVHPNAAGYDIIAQKVYPALNQACAAFAQSPH